MQAPGRREQGNAVAPKSLRDATFRPPRARLDQFPILRVLRERVLVFDGGIGTQIQSANLTLNDFRGLEGCNELLVETRPDVIQGIHERCFAAGADVVETNSFGASDAMAELGHEVPIFCTVTIETTGTRLVGSDIAAAVTTLEALPVDVSGLNCATGPDLMQESVRHGASDGGVSEAAGADNAATPATSEIASVCRQQAERRARARLRAPHRSGQSRSRRQRLPWADLLRRVLPRQSSSGLLRSPGRQRTRRRAARVRHRRAGVPAVRGPTACAGGDPRSGSDRAGARGARADRGGGRSGGVPGAAGCGRV
jgi:hypothetical protein